MLNKLKQSPSIGIWPGLLMASSALILIIGIIYFFNSKKSSELTVQNSVTTLARTAVTGLGRLEPEGKVIRLSAPSSIEGTRVAQLLVQEGDRVEAGQVIALLDSYETRFAALNQAKQQVELAQARLQRVKAGAQTGTIAAQAATIARLEAELQGETTAQQAIIDRLTAELNNAEKEYRRNALLFQEGAISASLRDSKRLPVETLSEQLKQAKATLNRTSQSY